MPVELRSDTFTKPTLEMRQAMLSAEVGDDVAGEDPTVNQLEARMADLLGKEAAVFACSGTQSNQMGLWANCQRGDEVLIESTGHIANYESGAPALLSGVSMRRLQGQGGRLCVADLEGQVRRDDVHFAPTSLLCLENSTNLGGGYTYSLEQLAEVTDWAHESGLKTHLDGARFFNACTHRGYQPAEVAAYFDTISICFSKGLGCPMGSILVGSANAIARARRARKVMGGALRQAGIVAAAAMYALDHHVTRLQDDHDSAQQLALGLSKLPNVNIDVDAVETNLVYFEIDSKWGTAHDLSVKLAERGVNIYSARGPYQMRACTHLDVSQADIEYALQQFEDVLSGPPARPKSRLTS